MAVIDRINRIGARDKRVLVGPAELVGPNGNSERFNFSATTRITGPVDVYEISDGSGANEGTYTVSVRPVALDGLRPLLRGVGQVALLRQVDGVNTPTAPAVLAGRRQSTSSTSSVSLGPVAVGTDDRLFVVVERRDISSLRYQLEIDRVLDAITISSQPSDEVTGSGAISFSVSATTNDGGTLSYQWQLSSDGGTSFAPISNGGVYSGATTDTLAISSVTGLNGNQYRVVITSSGGAPSVTSAAATLTVI